MKVNFVVASDSMMPLLKVGDHLQLTEKSRNLKIFDVIVFNRQQKLLVHYVWKNQLDFNNSVITRSLKNPYQNEEPVLYSEIAGIIHLPAFSVWLKTKVILKCLIAGKLQ